MNDDQTENRLSHLTADNNIFWVTYLYVSACRDSLRPADVKAFFAHLFGEQWDSVKGLLDHQLSEDDRNLIWFIGQTKVNEGVRVIDKFNDVVAHMLKEH